VHPLQVMATHAIKTLDIDSNRLVMVFMSGFGESPIAGDPLVRGMARPEGRRFLYRVKLGKTWGIF